MNSESEGELIDMSELMAMLGVSRSRAYNISKYQGFPAPAKASKRHRTWRRHEVEAWLDVHRPTWRDKDQDSGQDGAT
jgi:predicted DNA-binding transcriptional regulator AlpA